MPPAWPRPSPRPPQLGFQRNLPEPVSSSIECGSRCPRMHPDSGGKHTRNHKRGKMAGSPGGLWARGSTGCSWAGSQSSHHQGMRSPPMTQVGSTFPVKSPLSSSHTCLQHAQARHTLFQTLSVWRASTRPAKPQVRCPLFRNASRGCEPKQEHARVNTWAWLRGEGIVLTAVLVVR